MNTTEKYSKARRTNKTILFTIAKSKGITLNVLSEKTFIPIVTLRTIMTTPILMDGVERKTIALALGISIEMMDDICNGRHVLLSKIES